MIPLFANSCINPFIYAAKYGVFQDGVRRMVARITRSPQQVHHESQNSQHIAAGSLQVISNPVYQRSVST